MYDRDFQYHQDYSIDDITLNLTFLTADLNTGKCKNMRFYAMLASQQVYLVVFINCEAV